MKSVNCSMNKRKYTVNGEVLAGLNFDFRRFHPMELFTGKLSRCLTFKALKQCLYNINKYSLQDFRGTLENHENVKFSLGNLSPFKPHMYIIAITRTIYVGRKLKFSKIYRQLAIGYTYG